MAVDQAGSGRQPDPSMDVNPTKNARHMDDDNDQTHAEPIPLPYIDFPEGGLFQLLISDACAAEKELP